MLRKGLCSGCEPRGAYIGPIEGSIDRLSDLRSGSGERDHARGIAVTAILSMIFSDHIRSLSHMNAFFRRQLADYTEYHRDPWNCAAHIFGIISLFLAAILPLTMLPLPGAGGHASLAMLMVVPVLLYWLALDTALGLAIIAGAAVLLSTAAMIVDNASVSSVWILAVVLSVMGVTSQIVGHRVFERRQPALVDNPSHLLLGPMFVMAKLFIALGFRRDLAAIIGPVAVAAPHQVSSFPGDR
jgi:uncharacterized membrane protein YGL010W